MKTLASPKEFATVKPDPATLKPIPGKLCACSRPAVLRKMGSWVCALCHRVEGAYLGGGRANQSAGHGRLNDA